MNTKMHRSKAAHKGNVFEEIEFDNSGNFSYSTFIPKEGISLKIEVFDTKGNKSEKLINLPSQLTRKIIKHTIKEKI